MQFSGYTLAILEMSTHFSSPLPFRTDISVSNRNRACGTPTRNELCTAKGTRDYLALGRDGLSEREGRSQLPAYNAAAGQTHRHQSALNVMRCNVIYDENQHRVAGRLNVRCATHFCCTYHLSVVLSCSP